MRVEPAMHRPSSVRILPSAPFEDEFEEVRQGTKKRPNYSEDVAIVFRRPTPKINEASDAMYYKAICADDISSVMEILTRANEEERYVLLNGEFHFGNEEQSSSIINFKRAAVLAAINMSEETLVYLLKNEAQITPDELGFNIFHAIVWASNQWPKYSDEYVSIYNKILENVDIETIRQMHYEVNAYDVRPIELAGMWHCWALVDAMVNTDDVFRFKLAENTVEVTYIYRMYEYEKEGERWSLSPVKEVIANGNMRDVDNESFRNFINGPYVARYFNILGCQYNLVQYFNGLARAVFFLFYMSYVGGLFLTRSTGKYCDNDNPRHIRVGFRYTMEAYVYAYSVGTVVARIVHVYNIIKTKVHEPVLLGRKSGELIVQKQIESLFGLVVALHCIVEIGILPLKDMNLPWVYISTMYLMITFLCGITTMMYLSVVPGIGFMTIAFQRIFKTTGQFILMYMFIIFVFGTISLALNGKTPGIHCFNQTLPTIMYDMFQLSLNIVPKEFEINQQLNKANGNEASIIMFHMLLVFLLPVCAINFLVGLISVHVVIVFDNKTTLIKIYRACDHVELANLTGWALKAVCPNYYNRSQTLQEDGKHYTVVKIAKEPQKYKL